MHTVPNRKSGGVKAQRVIREQNSQRRGAQLPFSSLHSLLPPLLLLRKNIYEDPTYNVPVAADSRLAQQGSAAGRLHPFAPGQASRRAAARCAWAAAAGRSEPPVHTAVYHFEDRSRRRCSCSPLPSSAGPEGGRARTPRQPAALLPFPECRTRVVAAELPKAVPVVVETPELASCAVLVRQLEEEVEEEGVSPPLPRVLQMLVRPWLHFPMRREKRSVSISSSNARPSDTPPVFPLTYLRGSTSAPPTPLNLFVQPPLPS